MNVFNLFETKNDNDLMLAIQVVKSLSLEKEFEEHFKLSFDYYLELFDRFVPAMIFRPPAKGVIYHNKRKPT